MLSPTFKNTENSLRAASGQGVTAVLGPTNTGKTHYAIERMLAHKNGIIGLPLRLLAREVYTRIVKRIGEDAVALVTGEERILPKNARYYVCTVEAMPLDLQVEFVAIDEVQLATSLDRGHIFTDRMLNLRGSGETLFLGAETMQGVLCKLFRDIHVVSRPRMSMLRWAGSKKITRLPARSALVAFSANEVYAIAELIRRQRGGAAVVMGSLSPRTRNAQVALYQSGEVDFLVATDAIGMGLNLDLQHVAFAQDQKFDGHQQRRLTAAELAQIAGRAGRHTHDGTFGVTSRVAPFEDELIEALETHIFAPVKQIMWRNDALDFSDLETLCASLDVPSNNPLFSRIPTATDMRALEFLMRDADVRDACKGSHAVELLWDICRIPDYRKISPAAHGEMLARIFTDIAKEGHVNDAWFENQVSLTDNVSGDIDALSNRIAHIRSWTYLANHGEWVKNKAYWQEKTRSIEDKLSDVLHEALTKRFIDRRTSHLMKRLREKSMLEAQIGETGDIMVEGHKVGNIQGFRFTADAVANTPDAKAANAAAAKVLPDEYTKRSERLGACANTDVTIDEGANLRWLGQVVARIGTNENDLLAPRVILLADEQLAGAARDKVQNRLERWLANHIENQLRPLVEMSRDQTIAPAARGLAFRLKESFGILERRAVAEEVKQLNQDGRATLRKHGVRFGAFHVFLPALLKPAPATLICTLWAVANDKSGVAGLSEIPQLSASGRTSAPVNDEFDKDVYTICGFRILGKKAVRIDILERLADLIRPVLGYDPQKEGEKPEGAHDGKSFYVTAGMLSILGATHEDMEEVLKGLGYKSSSHKRSEIIPTTNPTDTEKPEQTNAAQSEAEVAVVTTQAEPQKQAEDEAQAQSDETNETPAPEEAQAVEEPTILLWRRDFKPRQNSGQRKPERAKKGKPARKEKQGNRSPQRAPKEKPADPDSPFAKLAQLKASLGGAKD